MINAEHSLIPTAATSEIISNRSARDRQRSFAPSAGFAMPQIANRQEVAVNDLGKISTPGGPPDIGALLQIRPGAARAVTSFELQAQPPQIVIHDDLQRLIRGEMLE
jgi:hypothetical protein